MWNWFNCYLSGRHEYSMWCEPGAVFLRCVHCGRRSAGWTLGGKSPVPVTRPTLKQKETGSAAASANPARVMPFNRSAAR